MKYLRKKNRILKIEDGKKPHLEIFKSINKAKKESWKIQMKHDNGLGLGVLSIVDKFPKIKKD